MQLRIRLRTLWAAESNAEIDEIDRWEFDLTPSQSKTFEVPELLISRDIYDEVNRGKINLRCHSVATQSCKFWEKGARLAEHTTAFFLNMDPAYGFFEETEGFDGGAEGPRSEARSIEASRSWKFRYNMTHPAYLNGKQDEIEHKDYLFEEMTKQTSYVLLRNGHYEALRKYCGLDSRTKLDDLGPEDVLEKVAFRVTDKILTEYYKG